MPNQAQQNLLALQQQAQAGQPEQPVAPQQVARPGDVARSQGLLSGIPARQRIKEQQDINNQQLQQQFDAQQAQSVAAQQQAQLAAQQDAVDFKISESTLRKSLIAEQVAGMNLERQAAGRLSPEKLATTADMLFDDRQKEMAPYKDRLGSYDQLMSVIDTQSGPASMAVLFKFISSMDDSVVRDSEGKMLSSSGGPVGELVNSFNEIAGGGFFGPEMRQQIKGTATQLAQATHQTASQISAGHDKRMATFAESYMAPELNQLAAGVGFNPGRAFGGSAAPAPGTATPPPAAPPGLLDALPGFVAD